MAFSGILVSAGTATTNPAPSTLSPVSPYPTPYINRSTVDAAWTAQAKPALFPLNSLNGNGQVKIPVAFVASAGAAVTYTVNIWVYCKLSATWIQPKDNASFAVTGSVFTYIDTPGEQAIFLQLSSISSGTVAIYFDNGLARAQ